MFTKMRMELISHLLQHPKENSLNKYQNWAHFLQNNRVLLLKDNVQLLAELPVRKLPDIMTLS